MEANPKLCNCLERQNIFTLPGQKLSGSEIRNIFFGVEIGEEPVLILQENDAGFRAMVFTIEGSEFKLICEAFKFNNGQNFMTHLYKKNLMCVDYSGHLKYIQLDG